MAGLDKIQWYVRRLRAMGVAEISHRVAEKLRQVTEPGALKKLAAEAFDSSSRDGVPSLPSRDAMGEGFLADLRRECDEITAGHWHMLRGHVVDVDSPPVWHRDYVNGGEHATDQRSHQIDHRHMPPRMDVRFVWEPSRWIQIARLAQAAFFLGDKAAAELAQFWLSDWVEKNPIGRGWNWTSPMEPAIRLINFAYIDALLRAADGIDVDAQDRLVAAIVPGHVWWVSRYRSVGSSANNHLLGELAGLSAALGRWPQCSKWCGDHADLAAVVSSELLKQFHDDGGNREQGLHYHLFAFEMGWVALQFARAAGVEMDGKVTALLGRAGDFFEAMAVDTEPWDYGDSDDAHVFPCYSNEHDAIGEWRRWFAGVSGTTIEAWYGKAPSAATEVDAAGWRRFEQTGLSVRRAGDWIARLDHSPLGFLSTASHGHLDALHLSLWLEGKALLIDPGTGGYYASREIRTQLATKESHNGPHFENDALYPQRHGPFLWANHHPDPVAEISGERIVGRLELGAALKREIEALADGEGWKVEDSGGGDGFLVNWQFAPGWRIEASADGGWSLERDGLKLTLKIDGASGIELIDREHREAVLGACSPYYGEVVSSPVISCRVGGGDVLVTTISRP